MTMDDADAVRRVREFVATLEADHDDEDGSLVRVCSGAGEIHDLTLGDLRYVLEMAERYEDLL